MIIMNLTDQQYNMLKNLEEEGIYGKEALPYIVEGFKLTEQEAAKVLLEYYKLPKLNQAGQVTMERYSKVNLYDITIGIIALIGICWALSFIL